MFNWPDYRLTATDPPPPETRVLASDGETVMIAALVDGAWVTDAMASNPDGYDRENDVIQPVRWWELPVQT